MARVRIHRRRARGFSLIELMLVVVMIAVLASLSIPYYYRFSARAQKAEIGLVVGHMRTAFTNYYQSNGRFPAVPSGGATSSYNPTYPGPIPVGQMAAWVTTDPDWADVASPDGAVRLRYQYGVDPTGQTLVLSAIGDFQGVGAYSYVETLTGLAASGPPLETPQF
jgi:prepilin-type N-terminal cleavage/methylation domain-containing protein